MRRSRLAASRSTPTTSPKMKARRMTIGDVVAIHAGAHENDCEQAAGEAGVTHACRKDTPLLHVPASVHDRHLDNAVAGAQRLRGELGAELEAIFRQVKVLQHALAKHLEAGRFIGEADLKQCRRRHGQDAVGEPIAQRHAVGEAQAEEATPVDDELAAADRRSRAPRPSLKAASAMSASMPTIGACRSRVTPATSRCGARGQGPQAPRAPYARTPRP